MIAKKIKILIKSDGSYLDTILPPITANEDGRTIVQVIAPFPITDIVSVNYSIRPIQATVKGSYLVPTGKFGKDVLDEDYTHFQTVADWNVFEIPINAVALEYISKYRAGLVLVSFTIKQLQTPYFATNYLGLFSDTNPIPTTTYNDGDYFIANEYNFTAHDITWAKGDYAYFYNGKWNKGKSVLKASTPSIELPVDPSLKDAPQLEYDEDVALLLANDLGLLTQRVSQSETDIESAENDINEIDGRVGVNETDIYNLESDVDDLETEIGNIKSGVQVVKKAEQDKLGNVINTTYETKAVVSGISTLISSLDLSKLNKEFTSLIEEVSLSLSDVFVVDKGSGARKVSLATIASYLNTQELQLFTIVDELPMENQNPDTIYLLVTDNEEGQNQLLEYIWIANQERWELIGSLEVDLSNYYTKTEANELFNNKVDKTVGKGLSTEDYTTNEKNKLAGIASGAEVNVQSDWDATSGDALILNKPVIPTNISQLSNDSGYITGYTETDPIFTAWNKSTGISITKSQVSDLIEATQALSGLMSATDKQRLDVLHSLLEEDTENSVVDSINEVLAIFNNYPEGADLVTALAGKVDKVTGKGLSTNDLTNTLKSNYDTAYSWGNHAVEGYLKAITKAMVEAVLTGTITSHNHSGVYEPANSNIQSHISSTSNPHDVSKSQVGLGNVDNTNDLDKPISTLTQNALNNKSNVGHTHVKADITDFAHNHDDRYYTEEETNTLLNAKLNTSLKGAVNGLAELGSDGKVPSSQLPSYVDDVLEYANLTAFPANGESGKIYVALDTNKTYRWSGSEYIEISASLAIGETSSTAGRGDWTKTAHDHTGLTNNPHSVTKTQVGLGNVDNTSDLDKPVSTAQQISLDNKVDKNNAITSGTHTKITYDAKGLVTGGSDLIASDIPNLAISKITSLQATLDTLDTSKQDKLVAGYNIIIDEDNVISAGTPNAMAYFNYASSIYGDKYSLFANAWEHSLTVDPSEIERSSTSSTQYGRLQYPNGEDNGVIIPNSVTIIGQSAFRDWTANNQPLVIPDSVTSIGVSAFLNWSSNNQPLVIPNSVTSIGLGVFRDWSSNNQPLVIPDSVTSIGTGAFNSWSLNNQPLVIPNSVTSISGLAFGNWSSVQYVEIRAITPPTLASADAFDGQNDAPIYVPDESVDAYKTATNWVDLADRIFPISDKADLMDDIADLQENKQDKLVAGENITIDENTNTISATGGGLSVETWNTATKTLALSDTNKLFKCSHTANQTLTIPTNATVAFPIGTMITFLLTSSNKVTFSGASGVTLTSIDSLVELATQFAMASLIKTDTNTWQIVGALE